jgi:hypothetical protein
MACFFSCHLSATNPAAIEYTSGIVEFGKRVGRNGNTAIRQTTNATPDTKVARASGPRFRTRKFSLNRYAAAIGPPRNDPTRICVGVKLCVRRYGSFAIRNGRGWRCIRVLGFTFHVAPNDEAERRGASPASNEGTLSRSSPSLLDPTKMHPAIARTDC